MKKLIALLLAVSITCAVATGCSEDSSETGAKTTSSSSSSLSDSSSEQDPLDPSSSTAEDSKEEEETTTTTTTSATEQETTTTKESASSEKETTTTKQGGGSTIKFEDTYTYKFQQQASSSALAMDLSMKYAGIDMPIEFKKNGNDFYFKMSVSQGQVSVVQEYYYINGTTYSLNAKNKTYTETKGTAANVGSVTNLVPQGSFDVVSSKEENGLIAETVKIKQTSAAGKVSTAEATYYYDKASGEPKKMDVTTSGIKTTVTVTKFEVGAQTIKLPDLTGWTKSGSATKTTV